MSDNTLTKINNRKSLSAPAAAIQLDSEKDKKTEKPKETTHDGKLIYRKGMLIRRTELLGRWKEVFFVLREDKLVYYKSEEDFKKKPKNVQGQVFLHEAMVDDEESSDWKTDNAVFSIASRGRSCVMQTKFGTEDKKEWMEAVRIVIRKLALGN